MIRTFCFLISAREGFEGPEVTYRVKDIDLRLVDKERLEQKRRDGGALGEDQKGGVHKGKGV